MAGDAIKRIDANMEAALERSVKRFEERLSSAYDRLVGSEPVSLEDRGKEYLTLAGDVAALKGWLDSQAAIHGLPIARTMLIEFAKDGERFVDKLTSNPKKVTGPVEPSA
ncbi:hypothetical protein LCGC14_2160450 [marine sediment metagenome]|uniref:Uncharacterized protein n=1 Tax=marine sediment metagenome TaxID=412755 RepID=A0A0F9EF84_9ZZZZ